MADGAGVSKGSLITGWAISGLLSAFLLFDGGAKIARIKPVVDSMVKYSFRETLAVPLGVTLILCTLLYLIPRTSVLGAILLVGYLGGATVTHVRAGEPYFFPIVFGILLWLGLWLREPRLKALLPLKS
ncbi:MAG TPA: DoxX family protein [Dongiaceae bacterium]|nr:DoxX family protein [Dongiaceae bacterium]